jgi:hypothetical protein
MPTGARAARAAPVGRSSPRPRGRALAEQILAVVTEIEQLPVRRGDAYRRRVLALADLCRRDNQGMLGDLLGTGRPLAEQILTVVTDIEQLPVRRGPAYRQQVLALADLCNGTTAMLGDLLGVSQQAAWETLHRARQDQQRTARSP